MSYRSHTQNCDMCGRFIAMKAGVSWAQSWGYCMDGTPELYDPKFRCAPCTEKHGCKDTNCAYPERYSGIIEPFVDFDAAHAAVGEG